MGKPERHAVECDGDEVCSLVAQARADANRALRELARQRHPAIACAAGAPFSFAPAPGEALREVPAAQFHRPCLLALEALELTVYGYCVHRTVGWERRREAVFSLRRPALWRRLVCAAPLLALTVDVRDGQAALGFKPARRPRPRNRRRDLIRLDPDAQDSLVRAHREQIAAQSILKRFARWLRRRRRN